MKLPLQVTFRDMAPLPSLESNIRLRVAKLERFVPDLISCHVVVDASANRHRQGHVYAVNVDVRVPGEELFVGGRPQADDIRRPPPEEDEQSGKATFAHERQAHEEIAVAMREAFDAMTRRLEDYARRRRGQVKQHAAKERTAPASP